jgi:hypothetical protein
MEEILDENNSTRSYTMLGQQLNCCPNITVTEEDLIIRSAYILYYPVGMYNTRGSGANSG